MTSSCLSRLAVASGLIITLMTSPAMLGAPANVLIIKGDDVTNAYTKTLVFRAFIERSHALGAKVSLGVICSEVTESSRDVFKSLLSDYKDSDKVEFWNHGWNSAADFGSGDYAYQKELYTRCQNAMKNASYYGKAPIAFGAPSNAINDAITAQVMNEDPDTRLFFSYNRPATLKPAIAFVYILKGENNDPRYVDITRSVNGLNAAFRTTGNGTNVVCLQFHPGNFSEQENLDYDTVINHALDSGWTIMLPREYLDSITVTSAPVITTQPLNQTVFEGNRVRFTAAASGGPAPTYQWQSAAAGSSTFTNIPGATGVRYTIPSAVLNQNGMRFRFVATHSQSQVISNAALLNVSPSQVTSTTLSLTRTAGANPSIYGASLTFRAIINPDPGNGATVNFKSGGNLVGSATTNAGVADFTITTLSYSGGSFVNLSAEFAGSQSFGASSNTLAGGQQVDCKTLTLSGATAQNKVFDGNTAALISGGSLVGLVNGDAVTANTGTFAQSAVGTTIPVTVLLTGTAAGNYSLTQPGLTANITEIVNPPGDPKWTNTAGGLWNTTGNWDFGTIASGSGVTANFNTLNLIADAIINLNSSQTIGHLVFGDTNTASAAGWALSNNGSPANIITLAGSSPTLTVNQLGAGKKVAISAVIAGTQGLNKAGTGTLALTGTNNYSGTTALNSGILQANHGIGLPVASYLSFNGGILETFGTFSRALGTSGSTVGWVGTSSGGIGGGFSAKGGPLTINLGGAGSTVSFSSLGGANLSGTLYFGATSSDSPIIFQNGLGLNGTERIINVTAGIGGAAATTVEVKGVINGATTSGRLKKTGDGTLILSGANTWSNYTILEGGTVIASRAQNGTTSGPLGTIGQIIFKGGTLGFNAASSAWDPSNRIAAATSTSAVYIDTGGQNITFGSALTSSQSGGLIKLGAGTLILSGTNNYTGGTTISAGTLALNSSGTINSTTSITIAAGAKLDTTAKSTYTLPAVLTLGVDSAGASGRVDASGTVLVISSAAVTLNVSGPLTAPAYVLASYGSKTGAAFASVTMVPGYTIDYVYNGGAQIALIQTSAFSSWITTNHPSLADKTSGGDPDSDGICNSLEFVFNGNPSTSDPAILPDVEVSGLTMVFSYDRLDASLATTTQTFQFSSDLSNWTDVVVPAIATDLTIGQATLNIVDNGVTDRITISIPKPESGGKLFQRLKVSEP